MPIRRIFRHKKDLLFRIVARCLTGALGRAALRCDRRAIGCSGASGPDWPPLGDRWRSSAIGGGPRGPLISRTWRAWLRLDPGGRSRVVARSAAPGPAVAGRAEGGGRAHRKGGAVSLRPGPGSGHAVRGRTAPKRNRSGAAATGEGEAWAPRPRSAGGGVGSHSAQGLLSISRRAISASRKTDSYLTRPFLVTEAA